MSIDPKLAGLLDGFFTEARELCSAVTRELLQLEQAQDSELLLPHYETAARGLHTLKGSAAILGLSQLSALAHQLEEVLAPSYKAREPLPIEAVDEILGGLENSLAGTRAALEEVSRSKPQEVKQASGIIGLQGSGSSLELGGWRVDAQQIAALMREIEPLRELRRKITERGQTLEALLEQNPSNRSETALREGLGPLLRALHQDSEEIGAAIKDLEERIKSICTLPAKVILEPLVSAVRGFCRDAGKEARLSFVGDEVSLDRRLLEALRGPLAHLIRNAIDHGIESPDERVRRGKHREGLLTIRLEQRGNTVFLEVSDDGGGLDLKQVRKIAAAQGISGVTEASADSVKQLIFRPGLSTRAEVSASSGRGVGLSAVKEQLEALSGRVEVESTPGQGTHFFLTLPAGLGSSLVLLVRCGTQEFGLPMLSVEEVLLSRPEQLLHEKTQLSQGGEQLPLLELGALLTLRPTGVLAAGQPIVLLQAQGQKVALAVDEISGHQEFVILPLPAELRGLLAYQGASTKADGEPLLILRPEWLVKQRGAARTGGVS